MDNEKINKKSHLKTEDSCIADAGEVKESMLLNAMEDGDDDYDAVNLNPGRGGQGQEEHNVKINQQTDLELGDLTDPTGQDQTQDRQFLKDMKEKAKKNEK